MASLLRTIGNEFNAEEELFSFLRWALGTQSQVIDLPYGRVARYWQQSGVQWWFPLDESGVAIDYHFHFASELHSHVTVFERLDNHALGEAGLFSCEISMMEPDGSLIGQIPVNLYLPAPAYLGSFAPGDTYLAQVACFAEDITTLTCAGDPQESGDEKSSPWAAESFVPIGTFSPNNNPDFRQSARALIGGIVEYAERKTNDATNMPFDHLQIRCLGMHYDVLAAPSMYAELPQVGDAIHGRFYMTAMMQLDESIM